MSFVGSMFSNDKGSGFQGSGTNIVQPTTADQANAMYQNALQQQQSLGGLANILGGQVPGAANAQNMLQSQLMQQAAGGGPNPAMAQLNQTTGQNISNQAALMAGQRGAGANVGLMARQAAQQGATTQQQAIGQASVMRAQQQLAAQGQLAGLTNTQIGQGLASRQSANQASQGLYGDVLNSIAQQNNANVAMQSNINNVNQAIASGNQGFQQGLVSGLATMGSSAMGSGGMYKGGMVPHYAEGSDFPVGLDNLGGGISPEASGMPQSNKLDIGQVAPTESASGPQSSFGQYLQDQPSSDMGAPTVDKASTNPFQAVGDASQGPPGGWKFGYQMGEKVGQEGAKMASSASKMAVAASKGGKIDGKAKVKGDSYSNDTVPAMLSPGEIVVPRSHAGDPKKAASFAAAVARRAKRK